MNLLQRMLSGYIPMNQLPPGPPDYLFGNLAQGMKWPLGLNTTLGNQKQEEIIGNFTGLVTQAYQSSGIIFAIEMARLLLFVQARFQYRRMQSGRPGDYFGTPELAILENPWPGATTGDLLGRMLLDADFGGIAFPVRCKGQIRCLRPDWTTMVLGSESDPNSDGTDPFAELIGLVYHPGGRGRSHDPEIYIPGEFGHFAPIPDPLGTHRGMPWMYPGIMEIMADKAATSHKLQFFEQGATPNLVISGIPGPTLEKYNEWVDAFEKRHEGPNNRWRTMYFQGDTKAEIVGSSMQQIDFKSITGAGEVRLCNMARVPPSVVGVSESLQGATIGQGNFASSMRQFADLWGRPYWQNVAGSLEAIIPTQGGAQLWYDDRDIPALKDDIKDAAQVQNQQGGTIRTLTDAGFKPETVIKAVMSGDFTKLEHTGLYSVQLQPPGTVAKPPVDPNAPDTPTDTGGGNGKKPADVPVLPARSEALMEIVRTLAARSPQPVTFGDGAFRIQVEPSMTTISEGAVQVEVPITVQPAEVTISEGAIQVEVNQPEITVEPAQLTIEAGAVQVDSPVTVEPAQLTISEGAIQLEVHQPDITVEPAQLTIEAGAVQVDSPITVEPANVELHSAPVTIEAGAVQVDVAAPEPPEQRATRKTVKRDDKGRITAINEEPV